VRFRKFIPPMSIILFLVFTFAGTYYVRLRILEKHMAAAMDMEDTATIAELAYKFPCPVNARDEEGGTPLHRAVQWGDYALAELLIRKGADVNAKSIAPLSLGLFQSTEGGDTPLHWAGYCGRKEITELLIAKGADVNAKDNLGITALQLAIDMQHNDVAEVLRKAGAMR
jgi:ankyrin repeat protein